MESRAGKERAEKSVLLHIFAATASGHVAGSEGKMGR